MEGGNVDVIVEIESLHGTKSNCPSIGGFSIVYTWGVSQWK